MLNAIAVSCLFFMATSSYGQIPYKDLKPPATAFTAAEAPKQKIKRSKPRALASSKSEVHLKSFSLKQSSYMPLRLRPILGYGFYNPQSFNNRLNEFSSSQSADASLNIGSGPQFGVALDYHLTGGFFAGLRLDYLTSSSASHRVGNTESGYTMYGGVQALPLLATMTYLQRVSNNFSIGINGGGGVPLLYRAHIDFSDSNVRGTPNGTLSYTSFPFTAMLNLFGEYALSRYLGLRFETGYRYLSSDNLTLTETYGSERVGSVLRDTNGAPLNVNFGGITTTLSLVVAL